MWEVLFLSTDTIINRSDIFKIIIISGTLGLSVSFKVKEFPNREENSVIAKFIKS